MEQRDLLAKAVAGAVEAGATYVEARYGRQTREVMSMVDGEVKAVGHDESGGWSVRLVYKGAWGFAASARGGEALDELADRAIEIAAETSRLHPAPVVLAPVDRVVAEHIDRGRIDFRDVGQHARRDLLGEINAALSAVDGVVRTKAHIDLRRDEMELVTSDGTEIAQELSLVGGGMTAVAEGNGKFATRTYPHHGGTDFGAGGFEWYEDMGMVAVAPRIGGEAVLLLDAGPCPIGVTTVILDHAMVGTVLHETVGHATELDRIIGEEQDNFGSSFVRADRIGDLPYASPAVTVMADATFPGGVGSYGFDAEGVAARRFPIIENGVLVNVTNSRECAAETGQTPNGTARASAWNRIPMARMTNLVLQPGSFTLESLIEAVDEGVYIQTDATTDIDDNRELCSFGGEIGWRIRHGRIEEPIDRPVIFTDTHSLLRQCDGVGSADELRVTGIFGCGKGQPWQFLSTGQGGPPARFRNVRVGSPTS